MSEVPGVGHRQTRSIASPPRCSPAPPVSGTSPYRSTTIGNSDSATSTGMFAARLAAVREAVVPVPGRRAAPGADDQLVEHVPVALAGPVGAESRACCPSPAAGTRSGMSCAQGTPFSASTT